ncbi:hypothetical protein LJC32_02040 [Oscillospiraceae bacterium OttesenSCG-928-F05]|nr:hypothetical protein [Oscillospiraceae bacterium OttesenSCG-928-F05]
MNSSKVFKLAEGIHNNNKAAFEALYQIWWDKAYQNAYGYLLNPEDAEDAAQEVFAEIWENRKKLDPFSFTSWFAQRVNTVCAGKALNLNSAGDLAV